MINVNSFNKYKYNNDQEFLTNFGIFIIKILLSKNSQILKSLVLQSLVKQRAIITPVTASIVIAFNRYNTDVIGTIPNIAIAAIGVTIPTSKRKSKDVNPTLKNVIKHNKKNQKIVKINQSSLLQESDKLLEIHE
jgi:hypothetical protein